MRTKISSPNQSLVSYGAGHTSRHSNGAILARGLTTTFGKRSIEVLKARGRDLQVVQEFHSKLRKVDELIGKLAFNLREIQGNWQSEETVHGSTTQVLSLFSKKN